MANNISNVLSNTSEKITSFWGSLNAAKKMMISLVSLLVVGGVGALIFVGTHEEKSYLFDNLSSQDTHDIAEALKKMGETEYFVDNRGIQVAAAKIIPLRMKLAQEGLPSQGQVGWEKFDNSDFKATEFDRNINKLRAIQGELARTITSIEGITSARVHIVDPKKRLFDKDQKESTAAIYIKTSRGIELNSKQIKGIIHLVSKSIEGMKPDNISIIDFEGKLLTEERSKDPTARETNEMLEFKRSTEGRLEEKVRGIVGRIVGPDRVEARVDVDLDFTKEDQTISDVDPDRTVVLSQNTTTQKTEGSGLNPTGIPGSKSNVPGEQEALNLSTSKAENSRDTELINYDVKKTISHRVMPYAKIKRISTAVIVDGRQALPSTLGAQPEFEARTKEEMDKIQELVKSAIGFQESRGDEVKVHNLLFQLDYAQHEAIQAKEEEDAKSALTFVAAGLVALALVLFFMFVVRPYFSWLSYDPERKERQKIVEEFRPDLELSGIQNVQVKDDIPFDKLSPAEQVAHVAKHEPMRTCEAIRILLNPHANV